MRGAEPVLRAMREHAEAQAQLYPLWRALPPVSRYFLEQPLWDDQAAFETPTADGAKVGIHHARDDARERGGFTFYVPERHDGQTPLALVVALHGGGGHGRHFLWTWLREARSRGFALLSPTSRGATWALQGPDIDFAPLRSMVETVANHWPIDASRVLLTGLSDGATYTLLGGLREDSPFTAFAPVSGVLHPNNFANGNLARAHGRRIYLVHGALDWMFPVDLARAAADDLEKAGADLTYRELPDLSHTYPRAENDRILTWFDPALALPSTRQRAAEGPVAG
jgi:phospholipase/carboxylesterase